MLLYNCKIKPQYTHITGHRQFINHKETHIIISEHFDKPSHTCEDLKGHIYNISDRQIEEQKLVIQ